MAQVVEIVAQPLTDIAFSPYGRAILPPEGPAPKQGVYWDCWLGPGELTGDHPLVGMVRTRPGVNLVTHMEREHATELLIPVIGPVVQIVGPPGDLSDDSEQPRAQEARAFVVQPGQAIVMSPGTWHCAAMPLAGEALYYFVTEPPPPDSPRHANPWVAFLNGDTVSVVVGG